MNDENDEHYAEYEVIKKPQGYSEGGYTMFLEIERNNAKRRQAKRKPPGCLPSMPIGADRLRLYKERAKAQGLSLRAWVMASLDFCVDG